LLIDSYFVTSDYLSRLNKLTYLTYIDDLNKFIYPCSELINYNIYADKLNYPERYPGTKLLLGPKYAPLREEFRGLPIRNIKENVESVLITTGGTDPFGVAVKLVERLKGNPELQYLHLNIVAGRFYKHIDELQELSKKYSGVTLHKHFNSMAELMLGCDVSISAGGTTLYELCACSMPVVVFSMVDNQLAAVSAFSDGYMLGCGDYRDSDEKCLDRILTNLSLLVGDYALRKELAEKCRGLLG